MSQTCQTPTLGGVEQFAAHATHGIAIETRDLPWIKIIAPDV
jgi:hypothetical protein